MKIITPTCTFNSKFRTFESFVRRDLKDEQVATFRVGEFSVAMPVHVMERDGVTKFFYRSNHAGFYFAQTYDCDIAPDRKDAALTVESKRYRQMILAALKATPCSPRPREVFALLDAAERQARDAGVPFVKFPD